MKALILQRFLRKMAIKLLVSIKEVSGKVKDLKDIFKTFKLICKILSNFYKKYKYNILINRFLYQDFH
jgi:hypothetical protein